MERGDKVAGYPFEGYWLDIGRHSDYEKALEDYERMKDALLAPAEVARMSPDAPAGRPDLRRGRGRGRRRGRALGWLTMGPRTADFEEAFAERVGTRHAVMVVLVHRGAAPCVRRPSTSAQATRSSSPP